MILLGKTGEIVYGPVSSWRLGRSLGVDLICSEKVCTFNCRYCQLGTQNEATVERQVFVSTDRVREAVLEVIDEVEDDADVITLSGTGEPTLAKNLGEVIETLHEISELPVAVLTNGSLLGREDVREEIELAEIIKAKFDAANPRTFRDLNQPEDSIEFEEIKEALGAFAAATSSHFSLEVMFTPRNMGNASQLAEHVSDIDPDEVHVNTPRRESPEQPLTDAELDFVLVPFEDRDLNVRAVHLEEKSGDAGDYGPEKMEQVRGD